MAKVSIKSGTWYVLLLLIVLVAALPLLRAFSPMRVFTQGFTTMCTTPCDEGQFCAGKDKCVPVATRYPNAVPTGDV